MLSHTIYSCPSVICSPAQLLILAGNTPTFGSQETCKKFKWKDIYLALFGYFGTCVCVCVVQVHKLQAYPKGQTPSKV